MPGTDLCRKITFSLNGSTPAMAMATSVGQLLNPSVCEVLTLRWTPVGMGQMLPHQLSRFPSQACDKSFVVSTWHEGHSYLFRINRLLHNCCCLVCRCCQTNQCKVTGAVILVHFLYRNNRRALTFLLAAVLQAW